MPRESEANRHIAIGLLEACQSQCAVAKFPFNGPGTDIADRIRYHIPLVAGDLERPLWRRIAASGYITCVIKQLWRQVPLSKYSDCGFTISACRVTARESWGSDSLSGGYKRFIAVCRLFTVLGILLTNAYAT